MSMELAMWVLSTTGAILASVIGWLCVALFRLNGTMKIIETRNDERHAANLREFDKIWRKLETQM